MWVKCLLLLCTIVFTQCTNHKRRKRSNDHTKHKILWTGCTEKYCDYHMRKWIIQNCKFILSDGSEREGHVVFGGPTCLRHSPH